MRRFLCAVVAGLAFAACAAEAVPYAERMDASFAIEGKDCIIAPSDCGLVNGHVTFNGRIDDVGEIRGLFAPPYYSTDFLLDLWVLGERIKATDYSWRPEVLVRTGTNATLRVTTRLYPVAGERAGIMQVEVENTTADATWSRVRFSLSGGAGTLEKWQFGKPGLPPVAMLEHVDGMVLLNGSCDDAQVVVGMSNGIREQNVKLESPGAKRVFYVCFAIGKRGDAVRTFRRLAEDPRAAIEKSVFEWRERVARLAARMPHFTADNAELECLYFRSLLHFLLNEWNVNEFALRPYYATGGMNGGCLGNYLWNHGEVYRMWPLLDPLAAKAHMHKFLSLDLTRCFAYDPGSDAAFGPYYPVNQEKILLLAHAYVFETGDVDFLKENAGGRPVIERLVGQALAHDDVSKPVALVDYGEGNHHLELRKQYRYDGIIPDMNLRRIVCYRLADALCRQAKWNPGIDLVGRARELKRLVKDKLFDRELGWFVNVEKSGRRDVRWTMQMFKALGWDDWALDAEEESALMRHLMSEDEFLGAYGMHSLSKKDPAYDENDVDNGGPGACVSFAPAVVDRLYRSGHVQEAENIFRRLWWLGGSLPYWGDSHYADRKDYRRDTPLQNDIQGAALAQTIIFGMFGVSIDDDFRVSFDPHLPKGVGHMRISNLRLAGKTYEVDCSFDRGVSVATR